MSENKAEEVKTEEKVEAKKEPFMLTVPDGESLMIEFGKHENDICTVMHAARLSANNEAKLIVKYQYFKGDTENMTDEQLKTAEMEEKEETITFAVGELEKELEYEFVISCDPLFEAQGSEIRIDGVFVQDLEEEDEYEYESYDAEEEDAGEKKEGEEKTEE